MGYNFVAVDRDQLLLMPPSVAEWLPEDHLARFVVEVVDEFDLSAFLVAYRLDGRGGAAFPPSLMVALLMYAYAVGERSSRKIERRCVEDVAFRFVAANLVPDHATIARFRVAHEEALKGLFGQLLALCVKAGLVRAGLLAIDGTKLAANASKQSNRTAEQLAAEILKEAAETDAAEDELFGPSSGNEMPEEMRGPGRKAKLRKMLDDLEREQQQRSFEAHLERRAARAAAEGRPAQGRPPKRDARHRRSVPKVNVTDPESRLQPTRDGWVQGYNAQAVVTEDQVIVAVDVTNSTNDAPEFSPMVDAARQNLRRAGHRKRVRNVVADAGYWSNENVTKRGVEPLIAPGNRRKLRKMTDADKTRAEVLDRVERGETTVAEAAEQLNLTKERVRRVLGERRKNITPDTTSKMIAKLATVRGQRLYKKRAASVEPVFAQIKHNRRIRTFSRRGLNAVTSEWALIAATQNLLKLWRNTATAG